MTRAMIVLGLIAIAHTARADVVSSGTLQMRTRHDLVIGVDAEAAIELAPGAERLIASAGSVALAADGQHAVLKLPTTRYPQVIIVAALEARGVVLDWLAIPLSGQAVRSNGSRRKLTKTGTSQWVFSPSQPFGWSMKRYLKSSIRIAPTELSPR